MGLVSKRFLLDLGLVTGLYHMLSQVPNKITVLWGAKTSRIISQRYCKPCIRFYCSLPEEYIDKNSENMTHFEEVIAE